MSPQPDIHICLECGNAEFAVPEKWLAAGWLQPQRAKTPVSVPTPIDEARRQIA
jgi:hypothetical protein